jgi:hypothetical protein
MRNIGEFASSLFARKEDAPEAGGLSGEAETLREQLSVRQDFIKAQKDSDMSGQKASIEKYAQLNDGAAIDQDPGVLEIQMGPLNRQLAQKNIDLLKVLKVLKKGGRSGLEERIAGLERELAERQRKLAQDIMGREDSHIRTEGSYPGESTDISRREGSVQGVKDEIEAIQKALNMEST